MKYWMDKILTLRRLRAIDSNRSAYSATGTADGYPASLQEPNADKIAMYGGQIGNLWECYVEENECPALEGDQVVIDEETYSVQNMRVEDFSSLPYKRLTLVKAGNNTDAN